MSQTLRTGRPPPPPPSAFIRSLSGRPLRAGASRAPGVLVALAGVVKKIDHVTSNLVRIASIVVVRESFVRSSDENRSHFHHRRRQRPPVARGPRQLQPRREGWDRLRATRDRGSDAQLRVQVLQVSPSYRRYIQRSVVFTLLSSTMCRVGASRRSVRVN